MYSVPYTPGTLAKMPAYPLSGELSKPYSGFQLLSLRCRYSGVLLDSLPTQCFSPGFCIKFLLNFLLPSLFRCFRSPRLKLFTAGMAHPVIIGKSRACSAQAAQYADRPENHHTAAGICKRSAAARMMNSHILRIFRTALWTLHAIPSPLLSYAQYIISSLICK